MNLQKRQILGIFLSFLLVLSLFTPQVQSYFSLAENQRLSVGDQIQLILNFPPSILNAISVYVEEGEKIVTLNGKKLTNNCYPLREANPVVKEPGKVQLQLKLFGFIPLKKIDVEVLPNLNLIPGGHSIGVLLRTDGVMVVGYSPILNDKNEPIFPAKEADINIGDIIVKVNDEKVITDDQLKNMITVSEKTPLKISIRRNGRNYDRFVYPEYCQDTKSYRIGLFVRDNAGGIGTLTFYDPFTNRYGALGHMIADGESNQRLELREGKILTALIQDIHMATKGVPGEKVGVFLENTTIGNIETNDHCGIYGQAGMKITNPIYQEPLPIQYSNNIQPGNAEILTVLKNQEIKKYKIIIEKIYKNYGQSEGKNMIIRINDEELLKETGGIVQGMSGSPIIQNGKIVGAVTHVFVNDPTRGYGVFIENMLLEAGILKKKEQTLELSQGLFFCLITYKLDEKQGNR